MSNTKETYLKIFRIISQYIEIEWIIPRLLEISSINKLFTKIFKGKKTNC